MRAKKAIGRLLEKAPVIRTYARYKNNHINKLEKAIKKLEDRNEEWAAEVRMLRGEPQRMDVLWPVTREDLIEADYRNPVLINPAPRHKGPFVLNWVVPPVGSVSGGHAVIFRVIEYLESQGHTCRVYFYDPMHQVDLEGIKNNLKNHHTFKAKLFYNESKMLNADAVFATGWTTAYPVFNFKGVGKKFYFLQDYEAIFEPSGTYSTLADNTYKMGLHGISTSPWTSKMVLEKYGMKSDTMNLAVNQGEYTLINTGQRTKVFFYARPVTPRRGFELGVLAFEIFNKKHPECEIVFIGWDLSLFNIPFPFTNMGIINQYELNALYNECAAGLALSFTSMSLLPVEMMASGCQPIVNDADYTRMVDYADGIYYAEPNPQALADALCEIFEDKDDGKRAKYLSKLSMRFNWEKTDAKLDQILQRELGLK